VLLERLACGLEADPGPELRDDVEVMGPGLVETLRLREAVRNEEIVRAALAEAFEHC